jgi:hypothetical protein
MTKYSFHEIDSSDQIRNEIAMLAAKMIAEEGAEYSAAKRRAAKQLLGNQKINGNILPSNQEIEQEVREYNSLFFAESQPLRLRQLREVALSFMRKVAHFNPYVIGAVLNGTAGEHSDIHLHLYTDNGKDVAIFLLNQNIDFDVSESAGNRQEPIEILSFLYQNEGIHLLIHDVDDLRHTDKNERGSQHVLQTLLDDSISSTTKTTSN